MATRGVYDDTLVAKSLALPISSPFQPILGLAKTIVELTPASVPSFTTAEQDFPLPGSEVGDSVLVIPSVFTEGISVTRSRIIANGTIGVTYLNATAAPITPDAGPVTMILIR